jgi:NADPH-dependent curcumin reductase CurA
MINRQVVLVSRPTGIAQAEHFALTTAPTAPLEAGQVRIRNQFLSVEPAMRGWIADTSNYSAPVAIGAVMRSLAVGEIVESRADGWHEGDAVCGWFGWQEEAVVAPDQIIRKLREPDLPRSLALGVLGINGVTAHHALTMIGQPQAGQTVVVSTAAGSVGSAVGQIAKIFHCRTVGITRGSRKCDLSRAAFGYDAAIDYTQPGLAAALTKACPDGVDIYFDNTAGPISDAVHPLMTIGARIIVCGTSSIAQWEPWPAGPRVERHVLVKRARMQGFVVFDHMARWESSVAQLAEWIRAGQLTYAEDLLEGLESCPDALAGLYRGENHGKRVIKLHA